MSAAGTPKQGDHVFNSVEAEVLRPFETLRSLKSEHVDGRTFLHDYLLATYTFALNLAETRELRTARDLSASAGAEADALRLLSTQGRRYPSLLTITPDVLRSAHLHNAERFGAAVARYEVQVLSTVQQALERAVAPAAPRPHSGISPTPGIAFQQMLGSAYDPAAALVVIATSAFAEIPQIQAAFHAVILRIAETLDRPGMWREPYLGFSELQKTKTGEIIGTIRTALRWIDQRGEQSKALAFMIGREISTAPHTAATEAAFGGMLHLIHMRLQQLRK